MRVLALCEETRHRQGLALYAAVSAEDVLLWSDSKEVARFQEFLERAEAPLRHESFNGRGSLLDLNYPHVKRLLEIAELNQPHVDPVQVIAHGSATPTMPCPIIGFASADAASITLSREGKGE